MSLHPDNLLRNPPNLNTFWGALVVEELIRNGVDHFFVSPGSRSTPITWAVAENARADSVVHYDERGVAYAALGVARGSGMPAAVVCTSGTAVANLFPAVVEASMSCIPLILLTADRPPELIDSGANQTIDQIHIFGNYVRWFLNVPAPTAHVAGRTALTAVDQAVYRACNPPAGPVHLNLMFREPLAPASTGEALLEITSPLADWAASDRPYTRYDRPDRSPSVEAVSRLVEIAGNAERGLLIAGQLASPSEAASVLELARALDWPVFPDVTSGLRLGPGEPPLIHYYDQMLVAESFREFCKPDAVIQIGSPYVSKRLQRQLQVFKPCHYVVVANHPYRHDPTHIATDRIESSIISLCERLAAALGAANTTPVHPEWLEGLLRFNAACHGAILESLRGCDAGVPPATLSEPAAGCLIPSLMPPNATMFLASSMPIREADMFAAATGRPIFATANRGASGVDGLVATAAGYAHATGNPVVLVMGDQALLHDLNSLALLEKVKAPVVVVVINNFGGGIFSFLPIAGFPKHFEKFWAASHSITFRHAADMFRIDYTNPASAAEIAAAVKTAADSGKPALIEVFSDREENVRVHREIQERIRKALEGAC